MRRTQARPVRMLQIGRLDVVLLLLSVSGLMLLGWIADPFLLAIVCALQLVLAGFGAIALIGPARAERGIARYFVPPVGAVCLTLALRLASPSGPGLLFGLVALLGLWLLFHTELAYARGQRPKTALDLVLALVVVAASAGIPSTIAGGWPPPLAVLALVAFVFALRAAEARGATGGNALGQAALHSVAIAAMAAALPLLELPGLMAPAVLGLGFYSWSGAADALEEGASARTVIGEFGLLAVVGLVVALLLYNG